MQGGSRWYVYNRAPFSVSHRFPFPSVSRPFPFHIISVSSVSQDPVSEVLCFIPFRMLPCRSFSVSFRFAFSVSHCFVSFRVRL